MRFYHIKEHGGRVVKGVNTTPDVGVDAIKKQAAKFGNKVDKDGRPPTLSKKVKGSKTNVLFNLGMAESVEERSLTKGEEKKKEKYVKGMKKSKGDFKDRYGKDAEAVMYATATKMAKEGQVHELQADELSEASEIYIDMDGVLVDFFGEWTKMQGVKDWKQIKNVGKALQDIRDTEDFWLKLKPTPNADKLLGLVKEIRGEYNILSAPLADDPRAEPHKREWIKKNLTAFPPKKVIITTDKAKYATSTGGTPNILIDDFGQNVAKWEAAGGVGFKHKDHKFERTAKELKAHMNKPVDEEQVSELIVQQQRPKLDVIYNIADRKDGKPFPLSYKDTGGASTGGTVSLTPDQARKFINFYEKRAKDEQKLMQKALTSVNNAKGLFNNLGIQVDVKLPNNPDADIPQSPIDKLKKNLDKDTNEGDLIPLPKNSVSVDSDATDYDFMKLGRNMANIKTTEPDDANMGDQDIYLNFFGGEKEAKHMIKNLKRLGYKVGDTSGYQDHNFDPEPTDGEAPPQIKGKDVDGKQGVMKLANMKPVQKDRDFKKLIKQYKKVREDTYEPIVVDRRGRIVNGHHRYDALATQGKEMARVVMVDDYVQNLHEKRLSKGNDKDGEVIKGFDPETMQALADLRAKYPHASDPLDALLKSVVDTDQDNDKVDDEQNDKLKTVLKKFKELEPKIDAINARLAGVEVQANDFIKKNSPDKAFLKKKDKSLIKR